MKPPCTRPETAALQTAFFSISYRSIAIAKNHNATSSDIGILKLRVSHFYLPSAHMRFSLQFVSNILLTKS